MFKALNAFFAFIESMFNAAANLAQAGENVTEWAKDESAFFNEKSGMQRTQALAVLRMDYDKELEAKGLTDKVEPVEAPSARKAKAK